MTRTLYERTLTSPETTKKEEIVRGMKKKVQGFLSEDKQYRIIHKFGKFINKHGKLGDRKQAVTYDNKQDAAFVKRALITDPKSTHGVHDLKIHSDLEEKVLTAAEIAKKESLIKSMKPKLQGFKERYGTRAKDVMYATATKRAKALAEESTHITESSNFMATYKRNESQNRHTANIVHLAKHFGSEDEQKQADFLHRELKKHGHQPHHEAAYALHQKLWPKAVKAHGYMKEESEQSNTLKIIKDLLRSK